MNRWRELLDERLEEAAASLGAVPGVRGLVLGGSVGRGEPWPLSDIDLLPIVSTGTDAPAEIERRRAVLVDWWAASGRAQTLDVGWLSFSEEEVVRVVGAGASGAAERMSDPRWFHALDKAYGGRGVHDPRGLAGGFARWASATRFDPAVVLARVRVCRDQMLASRERAGDAAREDDRVVATVYLRDAARSLQLVLVDQWGERLGSMAREWTRFEHIAKRHGRAELAATLAWVAGADADQAGERAQLAPAWLKERIDLAYRARLEVCEGVTAKQNARDQLAAFSVLVARRRRAPWGDWTGVPDPALASKLATLDRLVSESGMASTA
jgi:hypothetical protein